MKTWGLLTCCAIAAVYVLAGCSTYGVDARLRPYMELTKKSRDQLSSDLRTLVSHLPENHYAGLASSNKCVCRTSDGYFLTPKANKTIATEKALYIGKTPEEAINNVVLMAGEIKRQQETGQAQLAAAMIGQLYAVQAMQQYSYTPSTYYSPPSISPAAAYVAPSNSIAPQKARANSDVVPTPTVAPRVQPMLPQVPSPLERTNRSFQANDLNGNFAYGSLDKDGSFRSYDLKGNNTYGSIDKDGSFRSYDLNGNHTYGSIDKDGSFRSYDLNGNHTYGSIDKDGSFRSYDLNGNYQSGHVSK